MAENGGAGPAPADGGSRWPRERIAKFLVLGGVLGIAFVVVANKGIQVAGTNEFCARACHTMKPAAEAYERSVHFANAVGVRATCSDCHIVYESDRNIGAWQWVQLVAFKAQVGLADVVGEIRGTIGTPAKWERERTRLGDKVHAFIKRTDSRTCRGCHDLPAFKTGTMYQLVHAKTIQPNDVDCVICHSGIAHVWDHPAPDARPPARQPAVASIDAAQKSPGPLGDLVRKGKAIFAATATDPESRPYVGKEDRKSCSSCHRKDGTDLDALPLFGAAAAYPTEVDGKVMTLDDRIGDCFVKNLGGTAPPPGSPVMLALQAYVTSLADGRRMRMSTTGVGPRGQAPIARDAAFWQKKDEAAGAKLYASLCASCHGADGKGGAGPAVWGAGSWSTGSAMAKPAKLAAYIQTSMSAYAGTITDEQARDLAAFLDAKPHP